MKVLIVDDSKATLEIIRRAVESFPYRNFALQKTDNPVKALQIIGQWQPDIVLTDWNMPNITGLTLLKEIVKRQMGIHVGIITTMEDKELHQQALAEGASFVLTKPFTDQDLHNKLLPLTQELEQSEIIQRPIAELEEGLALAKVTEITKTLQRIIDPKLTVKRIQPQEYDEDKVPCLLAMLADSDTQKIRALILLDIYAIRILATSDSNISREEIEQLLKTKVLTEALQSSCEKVINQLALNFVDYKTKLSLKVKSMSYLQTPVKKVESFYDVPETRRLDLCLKLDELAQGRIFIPGF